MMNENHKELGMTNTKWFNASGAVAVAFKGYYSPQRYDNNQTNQTTAHDFGYHDLYLHQEIPWHSQVH